MSDIIFRFFYKKNTFSRPGIGIRDMGIIRTAFFLVGTTIGAGFLTGAELVRFFPGSGYLPAFAFSCVLFGVANAFFLCLGKKYGGCAGAMRALFGRAARPVMCLLLAVAFVPCSGMLAGLDALFPDVRPFASIAGLAVIVLFLSRGMKGVSFLNLLLVPVLFLCVLLSGKGFGTVLAPRAGEIGHAALYAAMNIAFSAPALMDAGRTAHAPVRASVLAAGAVFLCGALVLGGIYVTGDAALNASMPNLAVMRGSGLFFAAAACAVMTSLASALFPLFSACERFAGRKKNAAKAAVLLAAFLLSRLGLDGVIQLLYPSAGAFGALFSAVCIFDEYFFQQYYKRIHSRRQKAEDKGRAHYKVEFEHLSAVHDEVSQPCARNNVFAHDRADPRHADVDLEHRNDGGVG